MWELVVNYQSVFDASTFTATWPDLGTLTDCLALAIEVVDQSPDDMDFNSMECVWVEGDDTL